MPATALPEIPPRDLLRRVQRAALDALANNHATPCEDTEGCIAVVYLAGVADALAWAAGDGPLPRTFRERAA